MTVRCTTYYRPVQYLPSFGAIHTIVRFGATPNVVAVHYTIPCGAIHTTHLKKSVHVRGAEEVEERVGVHEQTRRPPREETPPPPAVVLTPQLEVYQGHLKVAGCGCGGLYYIAACLETVRVRWDSFRLTMAP